METPARTFLLAVLCDTPQTEGLSFAVRREVDWSEVLALATRHDTLPLLHRALDHLVNDVPVDVREHVRVLYAASALQTLRLEKERQRLTALLLAAGIPVIPWKGPVLAEQLYGDIALRPCVDLDLLVPLDQAWLALQILGGEGYNPGFAITEQDWPALRRAVNHLALDNHERSVLVELHWGFLHPMHLWSYDISQYWTELKSAGQAREGRLGAEEALVLLCVHGTNHLWQKLKWVVDIDRLLRRTPGLDWNRVIAMAGRMGGRRCLCLGLLLAREACGTPVPDNLPVNDPMAVRLAGTVRAGWFAGPVQRDIPGEYSFRWRSRERLGDRLIWVIRQLFAPRLADWQVFRPGRRCYPLFYLERPVRMVWKWVVRPALGRRYR